MGDIGRRRRRNSTNPDQGSVVKTKSSGNYGSTIQTGEDYCDDSDSEDKIHRRNGTSSDGRMYGGACSFGKYLLNPCLCLLQTTASCFWSATRRSLRSWTSPLSDGKHKGKARGRRMDWIDWILVTGMTTFGLVSLYRFLPKELSPTWWLVPRFLGRPSTDDLVNQIPLRIQILDFDGSHEDLGMWTFFHKFYQPRQPLKPSDPEYGQLTFVGDFGILRATRSDEKMAAVHDWELAHRDKGRMKKYEMFNEEIEDMTSECGRQSWQFLYNPSCNAVHEIDLAYIFHENRAGLGDDQMFDSFYINHGYYRDVWVVHQVQQDVKSILKISRWAHGVDVQTLFSDLRDALVMERLTRSPRIVDIWGHCGTAVWVEALPYEAEEFIVPGDGYIKQMDLKDEFDVNPQNEYTIEEKLDMAIVMAESLADLHGFKDGLIVHDDVQLCQWLRTRKGDLKLGDFNRAEIPEYDPEKGEYCKYNNGRGFGNYRAPEEFEGNDLDEGIDVFSFGNNIYALLTGLWVFYENEDDGVVQKKVIGGETAYIDPRYRNRSFIEGRLVEIMEECWKQKSEDRIDIFQVVRLLKAIREDYDALAKHEKKGERAAQNNGVQKETGV